MIKPGDEPIPGYRIEKFLGQGNFGQVWRAMAPGNTPVALKFIELTGLHGWKEFRAIQRVKQIRHTHLMPIVALWLLDNEGKIVSDSVVDSLASRETTLETKAQATASADTLVVDPTEPHVKPSLMIVANLLASHSLADRLQTAKEEGLTGIPREELLGYVTEAAKALDFLNLSQHKIEGREGSIQHCDVKPDNILVIGGSAVLADWGVAQLLAGQQTSVTATSLGGTPAYMPPECFNSNPCHTSDQYSLAVTYYHLRTGRLPFQEETYAAVFEAHRNGTLDFSKVSADEQQVLHHATAIDPSKRFVSCSDFVAALRDLTAAPTTPSIARRGYGWVAIASVLVLAAVLVGLGSQWLATEAAKSHIVIYVKPADATLVVDGKSTPLDSHGRAVLEEIPWGQLLKVTASKPGERKPITLEIDPQQPEEQHRIQLPYAAAHYAKSANLLLENSDFDGAVESLAKAIQMDPATYARIPTPQLGFLAAQEDAIAALEFSRDGSWLLAGTKSGVLRYFSLGTTSFNEGKFAHKLNARIKKIVVQKKWTAAICNQGDKIWLAPSDRLVGGLELALPERAGRVVDIVMTGDGQWLVAATEDFLLGDNDALTDHAITYVYAWDLQANDVAATRRESFTWDKEIEVTLTSGHSTPWFVLSTYATAVDSCIVRQCWVESKQERRLYKKRGEKRKIAVSRNDRLVAIGGERSDEVHGEQGVTLVDVSDQMDSTDLPWGHASLDQMAWDTAGSQLVSSDHNGNMHVWQIPEDFHVHQKVLAAPIFIHAASGRGAHSKGNRRWHLARDGLRCFASGWLLCHYGGNQLALWDSSEQRPQALPLALNLQRISAIAVSIDGKWIAVGGFSKDGAISTIAIWSGDKLRVIKRACERAAVVPKRTQPTLPDRVTDQGLPTRQNRYSREERMEIEFSSLGHPSAEPV